MKPQISQLQNSHTQNRQQIAQKNKEFKNQIRDKQRQQIFNNIRKQYISMYATKLTTYNESAMEIQKQNAQEEKTNCYQIQEYPLVSKIFEKYHSIPHSQMWQYVTDISQHLIDNNIYLSLYQQQFQKDPNNTEDQQSLLIHDLFYLTFQHETTFKFPRKFKFVKNGCCHVASYIALVSTQIMPDQLAYWSSYMSQEDKQLIYLAILPDINQQNNLGNIRMGSQSNLHFQAWVNHPTLRNCLLKDFLFIQSAAKAVREIVGYRGVHPDRLKNNKGQNLYELMCFLFHNELQSMVKTNSIVTPKLMSTHIQISAKIIQAKIIEHEDCEQLVIMLSKILTKRIESQIQLITPLFCYWIVQAFLTKNIRILSNIGYDVAIGIIRYDQSKFIGKGGISLQKFINFQKLILSTREMDKEKQVYLHNNYLKNIQ